MSSVDVHRITTVEQLRARIGEASAIVPLKLWKSLNETCRWVHPEVTLLTACDG